MTRDPHTRALFAGLALAVGPACEGECDGCAQAPLAAVERPWRLTRRDDGATVARLCCEACAGRWLDYQTPA